MQPNFGVERTSEEGATGAGGQMADMRGRKAIVSGQVSILALEKSAHRAGRSRSTTGHDAAVRLFVQRSTFARHDDELIRCE